MKRLTLLDVVIAGGLALTAVLAISSGFSLDLGAFSIRLHDWVRPLAVTTVLVVARVWLQSRSQALITTGQAERVSQIALLAVVLSSIGYWFVVLTTICGGSDSYGYVSASELLRRGQLIEPQPIAQWLPVANALDVATPAGYLPAADRSGIAPSYPLGFPALMAIAAIVSESLGPYLVPPICGIALLLIVWRLASVWYGSRAGWLAAALVAWDALVVTYAKQPMSDVPATMFALLSVWWLVGPSRRPALAGIAAGASFITRPGGIGIVIVLTALAAWPRDSRMRDASRFIFGLVPFVIVQALLQWKLFGSPFTTGYGPIAQLFAGATVWSNLGIYLKGLWTVHSVIWFVGLAAACLVRPRMPLALGAIAIVVSAVPYVLYFEFAHWETLRFLLPAIVLLSITAAGGLAAMTARFGGAWIAAATLVIVAVVPAVQAKRFLDREGVPNLMISESRYPLVATHLEQRTPTNAIVLAAQHSGSIRHYANRITLRWDLMRAEDLEPLMGAVAERGHPLYVVLEGTEQQRFTQGFADPLRRVRMYPFGQIRNIQIWELAR